MRISDWSSDVCSSDLLDTVAAEPGHLETLALQLLGDNDFIVDEEVRIHLQTTDLEVQPGSGERHRDCEQLLRNGRDPFDAPAPISDLVRVRKMCELCRALPGQAGRQARAKGPRRNDDPI